MSIDPLHDLVNEYSRHHSAYNASSEPDGSDKEQALHAAWHTPYMQLAKQPPSATTLDGALAAIRLVAHEEERCGCQPELTVNVLRAALSYFDGGPA